MSMSPSVYLGQHICLGLETPKVSCFRTSEYITTQKVTLNSDGEAMVMEEEGRKGRDRGRERGGRERRKGQFLVS